MPPKCSGGTCTIDGCDDRHHSLGLCSKHYERQRRRGGDPAVRMSPGPKAETCVRGAEHPLWKHGDDISYARAHKRLEALRVDPGICERCGHGPEHGRLEWAFDHDNAGTRLEGDAGPYSPDPADYLRLCASCHHAYDRAHRTTIERAD